MPRVVDAYAERLRWAKEHRDEVEAVGHAAREEILAGWTWQEQAANYRAMWQAATHGGHA